MGGKGIVIDFDFAAMDGAGLLFKTAAAYLKALDNLKLDAPSEARYLAGADYQDGLTRLFAVLKTKKTAPKAARELAEAFSAALSAAIPAAVTGAFKNFVTALTDRGVTVVILTRADLAAVTPAFESLLGDAVRIHAETSACYGALRGDSWRRACRTGGVRSPSTIAVTGSGFGVKAALLAGMGSVAVVSDHVAYQDFGGADAVVGELSGKTAKKVLEVLRV